MSTVEGLTRAEVIERRAGGQGNSVALRTSRRYADILRSNIFNPVNIVLYVIGAGLALVGDYKSAFATVVLIAFNGIVGIIQEVRAKKQLDHIALLARAKVSVIRDGTEESVDPEDLVLGDVIRLRAGDQVPVDGVLVGDGTLELDESALTGESELIRKGHADPVMSGSICVTGQAELEATRVGATSFANKLSADAREYEQKPTPMQRDVNRLLRVLLLIVLFFMLLAVLSLFVLELPATVWLQILAVITGAVSAGMLTLIVLNYSWGAVRIGQQGALVQQINAVEALSNVTVLCTDKTGTLTTNRIVFDDLFPVALERAELERALAAFAASASARNKTSEAILTAMPTGSSRPLLDEVPFSSARKWSGMVFGEDPGPDAELLRGAYVMGALEMLEDRMTVPKAARAQLVAWASAGLRVLAVARNPGVVSLHHGDDAELPPLDLVGLISFRDELRPHLRETLSAFVSRGVKLKVISGDAPDTVAALARQAGFPGELKAVSGRSLAEPGSEDFARAAAEATVFGRMTPQQKEALVSELRAQGDYVAMMGDGVNDILSLKKSDLGIAMESGSTATRSVAAIVLLNDSFEALPGAIAEGQRIVNSIYSILKMFMISVFAMLLLIIGVTLLQLGFPFTTLQATLHSFLARGAAPLAIAMSAISLRPRRGLFDEIVRFSIPASLLMFLVGLFVYVFVFMVMDARFAKPAVAAALLADAEVLPGLDLATADAEHVRHLLTLFSAQTALNIFFVISGVLLMLFVDPPTRWLAVGAPYTGRWLSTIVAAALVGAFIVLLSVPGLRRFFDLVPLPPSIYLGVIAALAVWFCAQWYVWKSRLIDRFLDI